MKQVKNVQICQRDQMVVHVIVHHLTAELMDKHHHTSLHNFAFTLRIRKNPSANRKQKQKPKSSSSGKGLKDVNDIYICSKEMRIQILRVFTLQDKQISCWIKA